MPRHISVAIPLYKPNERHLGALLRSLDNQRNVRIEVGICADSPLPAWLQEQPDKAAIEACLLRQNKSRLGMVRNWNAAVRVTSGDFVMLASQDDVLHPDCLRTMADLLEAHPGIPAVSVGRLLISDSGDRLGGTPRVNDREHIYDPGCLYLLDSPFLTYLVLRNGLAVGEPSCTLFRRSAFNEAGGYSDRFEHAADVEFLIRLSASGPICYLHSPLVKRRVHAGALTHTHVATGATRRDRQRLRADYLQRLSAQQSALVYSAHSLRTALDIYRHRLSPAQLTEDIRELAHTIRYGYSGLPASLMETFQGVNLDHRLVEPLACPTGLYVRDEDSGSAPDLEPPVA